MINTSRRSRVLLSLHAMIGSVYPPAAILQSLGQVPMIDRSQRRDATLGQPNDERIMKVQTPTVDAAIERPPGRGGPHPRSGADVATPQLNPSGNLTGGFAGGWLAGGDGLRPTRPEHDAAATPPAAASIDGQNRRRVSLGRTTVPTAVHRRGEDGGLAGFDERRRLSATLDLYTTGGCLLCGLTHPDLQNAVLIRRRDHLS